MLLEIESISLQNFGPYGNYITELTGLASMGPVSISGVIDDGDSNGAGKTTIPTAFLWCLTGRTFTKARPGDNVANWHTTGECFVELKTIDGWVIRRTRRSANGGADLLVYDSTGVDQSRSTNDAAQKFINQKFGLDYNLLVSSTFFGQMTKSFLETSDTVRKDVLEKLLGLDRINAWADVAKDKLRTVEVRQESIRKSVENTNRDIVKFEGVVASTDQKIIEFEQLKQQRIAECDVEIRQLKDAAIRWVSDELTLQRAKQKYAKIQTLIENRQAALELMAELKPQINQHNRDIQNLTDEMRQLDVRKQELAAIDFDGLRAAHAANEIANKQFAVLTAKIDELQLQIRSKKQDATKAAKVVKDWADKSGTVCPSCKQDILGAHVSDLCKPYKDEAKALLTEVKTLEAQHTSLTTDRILITITNVEYSKIDLTRLEAEFGAIDDKMKKRQTLIIEHQTAVEAGKKKFNEQSALEKKIQAGVEQNKPSISLVDIESQYRAYEDGQKRLDRLTRERQDKANETNPYSKLSGELVESIKSLKQDLVNFDKELGELSAKAVHYQYLWRSYSDRSKVKRLILSKLIPYLNERIRYYLDCFKLDIHLTFKDNLSIDSNVWGYDYCSGGERKRIDLSIMLSLYDLYLGIHGRQCNIMVFDEVDGRLDATGIESLINIIMNDFAGDNTTRIKPGTIFVISHRPEMVDAFPTKILVKRDENRMSRIVEIQ